MRTVFMIAMLVALLIVAYLAVQSVTSRNDDGTTNIKVIDKARVARDKAEQAGQDLEKKLDKILTE